MWYKNTVQSEFTSKSSCIESAKNKENAYKLSLKNYTPKFRIEITSLVLVSLKKSQKQDLGEVGRKN